LIVVGAPVGGLLGDRLGYRAVLWLAAAGFAVAAGALGISRFRGARLDDRHAIPG